MPILTRTENIRLLQSINFILDDLNDYDNYEDYELFWKLPTLANIVYDKTRIIHDKMKENEKKERELIANCETLDDPTSIQS